MREPSIHITRSQFLQIMSERLGRDLLKKEIKEVDKFFRRARQVAIPTRSLMMRNNQRTRKQVAQIQSSPINDANLMADVIYAVLIQLHHIGATKVKQSDREWRIVKELAAKANAFCETYHMEQRPGYIEFVKLGMNLFQNMKGRTKYNPVYFLNANYDKIVNHYEAEMMLAQDTDPQGTQEMYDVYQNRLLDMTGIGADYRDPSEYVHFLYAREEADKAGIDYRTYIEAQFDALAFCNGIPLPRDLHDTKAQERLLRYMSREGLSISNKPQPDIDWSKFKV